MPPAADGKLAGSSRQAPRWLLILAGAFLVARVATGVWEGRRPPEVRDLVRWRPIAGAMAEARALKKPLLYDFTADWCAPCQAMKREVFSDQAAAAIINLNFVPVRVLDRQREEGRNRPEVDSLETRFAVNAFPTLVVVSASGGEPIKLEGYGGPANTIEALRHAARTLSGAGN